jgi:hypothetical protein
MNKTQRQSLKIITEHLANISDDDFLKTYNECEKNIGPTVDDYLLKSSFIRRLHKYIEYATKTKRFTDVAFYEELIRYIENDK